MNKFLITALSLGSLGLASAQTTAYTQAVGYVKLGNTTSGVAVPANTDITVSVPFHNKIERALTISSVTAVPATATTPAGAAISVTETLVASEFAPSLADPADALVTPYVMAVSDGTSEGSLALVSTNSTNGLTVTEMNDSSLASIPVGSKLQLFRATTLGNFFTGTIPAGTRCLTFSNNIPGINVSSDLIYVYTGSSWVVIFDSTGSQPLGSPADDAVLHPGESIILRAATNPITDLICSGVVPDFNHKSQIPHLTAGVSQDTRIAYFGSCGDNLLSSGLGVNPGDRLLVFDQTSSGINKSADQIFVYNGSGWIHLFGTAASVGASQDTYQLESGAGYVYRTAPSTAVGYAAWTDAQTYRPNLYLP